ncbi:MAB_1171c family putative transporter [Saccharothrix coeruleofusca]|nr:MAB_1171c family putative transporter [Saccharothrix coeruleofusca]
MALATALSLGYLVRSLGTRRANRALRALCGASLAMSASVGLGMVTAGAHLVHPIDPVKWWISVVQHGLTMSSLYLVMAFFLFSVHPLAEAKRLAKRHGAVLLAAIAIAVAFAFMAAPADYSAGFLALYVDAPFSSLYLAVYAAYLGTMVLTVGLLSARWARLASDPWIRRGMAVGTAGCAIGVVYSVIKVTYLLLARFGVRPPVGEMTLTGPVILVAVPLGFLGLTVPGWGPRLTALIRWARLYRAHHQLHSLWAALTARFPHVTMDLGSTGIGSWWDDKWAPRPREMDLRLHLRVVQIWDARRALTDYCDPAEYDHALATADRTGLSGDQRAAFAEAAMLTSALERHERVEGAESFHPRLEVEADLARNVAWLREVSRFVGKVRPAALSAPVESHSRPPDR